jgi:catechol 2,3-dioxygenase-like lactoylglutathione lyase family enzyme
MALESAAIVAFVATTDLDRARAFYGDVLGLTVEEVNEFACVLRSGSTMLRVTQVGEFQPQPFTVLGWDVADLDRTVADLTRAGVEMLHFDGMGQDEAGVWTAPSGGRIAWFHDPDGNVLSLTGDALLTAESGESVT